jgi:hypothetical protein
MATNLAIDPELIELALEVSGERTRKPQSQTRENEAGIESVRRHKFV